MAYSLYFKMNKEGPRGIRGLTNVTQLVAEMRLNLCLYLKIFIEFMEWLSWELHSARS